MSHTNANTNGHAPPPTLDDVWLWFGREVAPGVVAPDYDAAPPRTHVWRFTVHLWGLLGVGPRRWHLQWYGNDAFAAAEAYDRERRYALADGRTLHGLRLTRYRPRPAGGFHAPEILRDNRADVAEAIRSNPSLSFDYGAEKT